MSDTSGQVSRQNLQHPCQLLADAGRKPHLQGDGGLAGRRWPLPGLLLRLRRLLLWQRRSLVRLRAAAASADALLAAAVLLLPLRRQAGHERRVESGCSCCVGGAPGAAWLLARLPPLRVPLLLWPLRAGGCILQKDKAIWLARAENHGGCVLQKSKARCLQDQ